MIRFISSPLAVALLTFPLLLSCGDGPTSPAYRQQWVGFRGSYANPDGASPVFTPAAGALSGGVSFDSISCTVDNQSPLVRIVIKNLSVSDSMGNTEIDSLRVEELRGEQWIQDVEFQRSRSALTRLAVVLVLDASQSLGDDFARVKEYALQFVDIVIQNAPDARIGVVVFSETIESQEPTTNMLLVKAFISGAKQGNYTALYSAMLAGTGMLSRTVADGKAMVTFTDGINNYLLDRPDSVLAAIQENGISSYTIGLQGEGSSLDEEVLDSLANRDFRLAPNITVLSDIFQRFSRAVTNVYEITYTRNTQPVQLDSPVNIRFRFRILPSF